MPNPLLNHIEEQEKVFEEKYCNFEISERISKPDMLNIKSFNRQSLISLLEANIERLEGERVTVASDTEPEQSYWDRGFNSAIDAEITSNQDLITALRQ